MAKQKKRVFAVFRKSDNQLLGIQEAISGNTACTLFKHRGGHGFTDPFISELTARPATKTQISSVCPICRYSRSNHTKEKFKQCKRTRLARIRLCALDHFVRANDPNARDSP